MAENSMVSARSTKTVAKPSSRLCLWASKRRPHVGDERGVFRNLGRQRVNPSRGVQELPVGAGDRPNADEDVADAEEAAERFAIHGVLEVGRLRFGDQLLVRPLRDNDRSSIVLHERGGGKAQRLRARAEVFR